MFYLDHFPAEYVQCVHQIKKSPKFCVFLQGCILAGISFLSISSILLPTRKSGIRRDKYLSAPIFKEVVHSDDS